MTMKLDDLLKLQRRLGEIKKSKRFKNERLANFMTDMEQAYNIPALMNEEFNEVHPFVIAIYREASRERSLGEGVRS